MRIATWNINGVKARIDNLLHWLRGRSPDVVCLQEIKMRRRGLPASSIEELGYNIAVHGQKGFNGVALLSKLPLEDVQQGLAGDRRRRAGALSRGCGLGADTAWCALVGIYMPNGNPIGTEKFAYKLAWLKRLEERVKTLLQRRSRSSSPATSTSSRAVDVKAPEAWVTTRCSSRRRAAPFRAAAHSA